jgi:hypothetical protein
MYLSQKLLRQILGVLWLIDGLLQLQPLMFTMNMVNKVLSPITAGQPGFIKKRRKTPAFMHGDISRTYPKKVTSYGHSYSFAL